MGTAMGFEQRLVPACISARLAAFLLDTAIVIVIIVGTMAWSAGTTDLAEFLSQTTYGELATVLGVPLAVQLTAIGLRNNTIGMWLAELKIVQAEGDPIEWGHVIRRPLGILTMPLSILLMGLVPALNEHRRTIGDFLSGTRVVEKPARGEKVAYDAWRVFVGVIRPMAPVSLAVALGVLLLNKSGDYANRVVLLDAAVIAATWTLTIATMTTVLLIKASRVRIDHTGIYRGSLTGWQKKAIPWEEMDHARVIPKRMLPYFEVTKKNRRRFKVPLECHVGGLMAQEFARRGIRIEP
ncbi:MAG: RDD family protein [Gammaproteobacteria bacterium]|nr:MAG: RDD family protein [Gammaproteobacteria bacterium]